MTHKFKLPSGVEMEVTELTGKQQKIITEQNKKPHADKLAEMLLSVTVRIGSNENVSLSFIKDEMLACDKAFALTELRQFSLDFEDEFVFMHTYKDDQGNKQTVEISEKIPDSHFPMYPVKKLTDEAELVAADYSDYSEIQKEITVVLPKSKKEVRFTMLDGKGESIGNAIAKNKRSSHTPIQMRKPVYFEDKTDGKGTVPIQLNLDTLGIKDIEYLRGAIKDYEGRVDTEVIFENPKTDKEEVMSVISSMAFFFPSEAI